MADRPSDASLSEVLETARERGLLGPGPVADHVRHARGLIALLDPPRGPWLDLGSGGGVPGLVCLIAWPTSSGLLLDASTRRTTFLAEALARLGLEARATVVTGRAEDVARDARHRGRYALVVARSFGAPAVTAECAVGFLVENGRLAVSEPPEPDPLESGSRESGPAERWPEDRLHELGLSGPELRRAEGASVAIMTRMGPVAERWPRRTGVPSKRPLW